MTDEYDVLQTENNGKSKKKMHPFVSSLFEWLDSFVISLVIVILLFTFFFGKVEVDGESMRNTLQNHDQLIISDFNYTAKNGDIVIISRNYTNSQTAEATSDKPLVKRVIATAGQTVEIKDGEVFVNDEKISEEYALTPTPNKGFDGKQTVPDGCVFVMGDNRDNSHDSRMKDIGFVDTKYILGRVLCRIFPFDSIKGF